MKSAIAIALLAWFIGAPAHANEIETGTIMVCDTQKQVERFGQLFDGNAQATISAVNSTDKDACGVADVTYVQGKPMATVRSKSHTFHVVPVIVVGVNTASGFQPVNSAVLFTLVQVKEYSI